MLPRFTDPVPAAPDARPAEPALPAVAAPAPPFATPVPAAGANVPAVITDMLAAEALPSLLGVPVPAVAMLAPACGTLGIARLLSTPV
jgi:hypothetical protein